MPDSFEDILYEVGGGRATITINRPERLNAFRAQTIAELAEAFEAAADDEAVGVIVFTGAGERAFCVGGDVREPTRTPAEKRHLHHLHDRLACAIRNNGKPIIVKVRGYCIGGGNELNVLCDLTISGASGRFGQAGPKIGSAPLWWGCQLLPQVVGEKKAREILYLTRQYTAEEALAMGLVNAVVPDEELDAEVDRWCAQILRRSPQGLRLAKLAMNTATDALYSAVQHGLELVALNHVYGPEPKRGDRQLPGEAPRRLAQVPRGPGPGARLMTLGALRPALRDAVEAALEGRRLSPTRRSRSPTRAAPSTRPCGRRRPPARPGPAPGGHLLAQGLHPADQPVPGRLLVLHLRPHRRGPARPHDEPRRGARGRRGRPAARAARRPCSRWATAPRRATRATAARCAASATTPPSPTWRRCAGW